MTMSKNMLYMVVGTVLTTLFIAIAIATGGDGEVGTSATEVAKSATGLVTSSTRFWVLFILGAIILALWMGMRMKSVPKNERSTKRLGECFPPVWAFVTLLGITMLNWLFWAIAPEIWSEWLRSKTFWPMNLALMFLSPVINFKKVGVWVAVISVPFVAGALLELLKDGSSDSIAKASASISAPVVTNRMWDLPAELVLPIIAECESDGRQFDDEGNLIKNPSSSAIGKYGIMASLHEERAKGMGLDIRTLEGNEGYANVLFSESGTKHWEADPLSQACWEPKLLAFTGGSSGADTYVALAGKPIVFSVPPGHRWDMVGEIPSADLYYSAYLDGRGNRIQTIGVTPPALEALVKIKVTKCKSIETCAW